MRIKHWVRIILLLFPAAFWLWSEQAVDLWWAENWSSVPGVTAIFYLLGAVWWLFRRWWAGFIGCVCIFGIFLWRFWPETPVMTSGCDSTVKVLQYNLLFENQKTDQFIRFVRKSLPDLLILQEVTPRHGALFNSLIELYPYRYGGQPKVGYPSNQLILSRQRLYGMSVYRTPDGQSLIRGFWQPQPGIDVALFTAHPPSPRNAQFWHRRNMMIQSVEYLTGFAPVEHGLVVGDFNLSAGSRRYQRLFPGFSSVPVASWPALTSAFWWPFDGIGIDHLWFRGDGGICTRYAVKEIHGSDHWPVMTGLSFKDSN